MWDYSEKVMDHYRNPRNVGSIDNADAVGVAGSLTCGDQFRHSALYFFAGRQPAWKNPP